MSLIMQASTWLLDHSTLPDEVKTKTAFDVYMLFEPEKLVICERILVHIRKFFCGGEIASLLRVNYIYIYIYIYLVNKCRNGLVCSWFTACSRQCATVTHLVSWYI
jgi:hypothetical protein